MNSLDAELFLLSNYVDNLHEQISTCTNVLERSRRRHGGTITAIGLNDSEKPLASPAQPSFKALCFTSTGGFHF